MKEGLNIRCPKCSSTQTRYRLKTKDHQCYVCGNSWEVEEEQNE